MSSQKQHENLNKIYANKSKYSKVQLTYSKSLQDPAVIANIIPMDNLSPRLSTKNPPLSALKNVVPVKESIDSLFIDNAPSNTRQPADRETGKYFQNNNGIVSGYSETSLKIPKKYGSSVSQGGHHSRRQGAYDASSLKSDVLSAFNSDSTINFKNNDGEDSCDDEKSNLTKKSKLLAGISSRALLGFQFFGYFGLGVSVGLSNHSFRI